MAKSKRHTIQWSKVKDTQYNGLVIVLCVFYFWPLYCVSFTFGHCIVCPLLLAIVLCVLYFWPLYCVSFTFGHCIVCPLLLAIVLCVLYFWPLYCVSFTFGHCIVCLLLLVIVLCVLYFYTMAKSKGHTIQWSKVKDTQYNGQK
jgi:uncharacterized membrane protein